MHGRIKHLKSLQVGSTVTDIDATNAHDIANAVLVNTTAAIAYLQVFWLAAASVTLGTTAPDVVIPLPASGGVSIPFEGEGWHTASKFSVAGTTGRTNNVQALVDVVLWEKL